MNYTFPEIRTIDDVLPHIEGREELSEGIWLTFVPNQYSILI